MSRHPMMADDSTYRRLIRIKGSLEYRDGELWPMNRVLERVSKEYEENHKEEIEDVGDSRD